MLGTLSVLFQCSISVLAMFQLDPGKVTLEEIIYIQAVRFFVYSCVKELSSSYRYTIRKSKSKDLDFSFTIFLGDSDPRPTL